VRKGEKETGLIVIERCKVREKGTDKAREREKKWAYGVQETETERELYRQQSKDRDRCKSKREEDCKEKGRGRKGRRWELADIHIDRDRVYQKERADETEEKKDTESEIMQRERESE
jgi:hypothetical protein